MSNISVSDLSILLVEPSHTQRKIIVNHLREAGIKNTEGTGAPLEALDILTKYPPDLVISAMYFDNMTGTDLIHEMRKTEALAHVPFMLISSEHNRDILDPVRQAGVIAILPKPFEHQDLCRALYATLDYIDPDSIEVADYDVEEIKVLVVDDSSMARRHVTHLLNAMGIERIAVATNGKEALEFVREQIFDLVITDYNMPEMDGGELVEFIRSNSSQSDVPILMITSEAEGPRLVTVRQSGVSAILDKPFETQQFKHIIERIIGL